MSIALKGFITGLASGVEEKFDEEREQTRKVIAARTQNAYKNYLTYQEQRNSLIEEVKKRDALALQFQGDLTDEERISLATMPNALELYQKALEDGKDVKLRDIIKVGDKAKGMKYEDFVKTLGVVQPAAQGMQFKAPESFFGTPVEKQQKFAQQLAETAGVSTETLAAFEQPVEKPMMAPMGSIDVEFMRRAEKGKTPEQRLAERQSAYLKSEEENGPNHPTTIALKTIAQEEKARQEALNPKQKKFADFLDKAKMDMAEARPGTPEYQRAEREVARLSAIGKEGKGDVPTLPQLRTLFKDAAGNAVENAFAGSKDVVITTDQFGNKNYDYKGSDKVAAQIKKVAMDALKRQASYYLDAQGKPINQDVAAVLTAFQVPFDKAGRPIFDVKVSTPSPEEKGAAGATRLPTAAAQPAATTMQTQQPIPKAASAMTEEERAAAADALVKKYAR